MKRKATQDPELQGGPTIRSLAPAWCERPFVPHLAKKGSCKSSHLNNSFSHCERLSSGFRDTDQWNRANKKQ